MWIVNVLCVLSAVLLSGCQVHVVPPDSGPPVGDAAPTGCDAVLGDAAVPAEPGPYAADDAWCPLAERRLLKLCCRDPYGRLIGDRNADKELFRDVCRDTEVTQGIPLNAKCMAKAANCDEVKRCSRTK